MGGGIPQPLRVVASAAAVLLGGFFTLSLASLVSIRALQSASEAKRLAYNSSTSLSLSLSASLSLLLLSKLLFWDKNCFLQKKLSPPCSVCEGKGLYPCKLCRGASTVEWSPMSDPIAINPCLCPTCQGNRVQCCLNCLGKGFI